VTKILSDLDQIPKGVALKVPLARLAESKVIVAVGAEKMRRLIREALRVAAASTSQHALQGCSSEREAFAVSTPHAAGDVVTGAPSNSKSLLLWDVVVDGENFRDDDAGVFQAIVFLVCRVEAGRSQHKTHHDCHETNRSPL
jgi:hypothetical protein